MRLIDKITPLLAKGLTQAQVARRLRKSEAAVSVAIKRAELAAKGLTARGTPARKAGRPRKDVGTVACPHCGGTGRVQP